MTNQSLFSTFKHNIFLSVIKILANAQCWMFLDYILTTGKNEDQFTLKHCKGIISDFLVGLSKLKTPSILISVSMTWSSHEVSEHILLKN